MKYGKITFFALAAVASAMLFSSAPASACSSGDKAEVLWKGGWYPAHVVKGKGSECYIHYDGYGNNWDEWVGPDRIKVASARFNEGDSVQVKWKGSWWPAHVLKAKEASGRSITTAMTAHGTNGSGSTGFARP
jgi:hypothetical protein